MSTTSRKAARKQLASILQTALVGTGLPAQAVYDNQVGDFQGQSPVVVVSSGGTLWERFTAQGMKPKFALTIHVFVLYADEAGTWTEADAEDALDDIDQIIGQTISANQKSDYWQALTYANPTQTGSVEIGGKEYRTEQSIVRLS